jgi:hypothetical protein
MTAPSRALLPRFSSLLLLLLVGPAAVGGATGYHLGLDQVPAARELRIDVVPASTPAASAESRTTERSSTQPTPARAEIATDAVALTREWLVAAPAPAQRILPRAQGSSNGFGKWIKKHWYVPVLAAVGVALAVQDDSSDPNDPED